MRFSSVPQPWREWNKPLRNWPQTNLNPKPKPINQPTNQQKKITKDQQNHQNQALQTLHLPLAARSPPSPVNESPAIGSCAISLPARLRVVGWKEKRKASWFFDAFWGLFWCFWCFCLGRLIILVFSYDVLGLLQWNKPLNRKKGVVCWETLRSIYKALQRQWLQYFLPPHQGLSDRCPEPKTLKQKTKFSRNAWDSRLHFARTRKAASMVEASSSSPSFSKISKYFRRSGVVFPSKVSYGLFWSSHGASGFEGSWVTRSGRLVRVGNDVGYVGVVWSSWQVKKGLRFEVKWRKESAYPACVGVY